MKGLLNDLWKYSNGSWTWISGSNFVDANGTYGTQGVASTSNHPGARQAMGFGIDSSGSIWMFGGFGYDSIFIPEGFTKTFAEMSFEEKNLISHRANAINNFVKLIKELYKL